LAFSLIERVFTVSGLTPSLRFPELGNMPGRFSNLLDTKLHPPRAGSDEVVRPRLLEAIDHGTRAKLTVIVTPAGYGKSTLAAQWQRRAERACCWLTLDSADYDPLVFFDYLMGAIHSIDPCLCPATEALLSSASPLPAQRIVHSLLNEVAASTRPFVVILDDYFTITSPEVRSAVSQIVRGMPINMSVVIISRVEPDLPTLQMSARGELVELGPAELSFTLDETRAFLSERQDLNLSASELQTIADWCEGWPVALRLASRLMHGRTRAQIRELLATLPENVPSVGNYLWNEVLEGTTPELHAFLLETAILKQVNPDLAAAVTDNPLAAELLAALYRDNFLLARIDGPGNWLRYHHLLSEALRQRLPTERTPAEIRVLHERAAAWYELQGLTMEAAAHAIQAEDWDRAARLLTDICGELYAQERVWSLRAWLAKLPDAPLEIAPNLAYWLAWAELRSGHPGAAIRPLEIVDRASRASSSATLGRFKLQLSVLRSVYEWDAVSGSATANRLLAELGPEEHAERARVLIMLALLQDTGGNLAGAAASLERARTLNGRSGIRGLQVLELNATGGLLLAMGKLREPAELFHRIIGIGDDWNDLPVQHAHHQLGTILLEWGRPDEARMHALTAMEIAQRVDTPIQIPLIRSLLARLAWAAQDWEAALDEIEQAIAVCAAAGAMGSLRIFEEIQCRLWLATNQLTLAQGWLQQAGPQVHQSLDFEHLLLSLTAVRVRIHEGRGDEVVPRLDQLRTAAERGGWNRELISIHALGAIAHWEIGETESARTAMVNALRLAEPEGFTATLTLEGARIVPVLESVIDARRPGHVYAATLLGRQPANLSASARPGGTEPAVISARERDVMRLVAAGLSNREIGDALFISEETVKTHLRRIFEKLDVSSRTQAVATARSRGLL
jgi:LuxR family maltose regulon positive regulatory protein